MAPTIDDLSPDLLAMAPHRRWSPQAYRPLHPALAMKRPGIQEKGRAALT
jgi:hypothetical protein